MTTMNVDRKQLGFTLIELMVAIVIVGILVAVALPSYRQYMIKNSELEAQSQMGIMQTELERWRTTAMSYRGFFPANGVDAAGKIQYQYSNQENTIIYVPIGSNADTHRYTITLVDGSDNVSSLTPVPSTNFTLGRSWVMLATPNPNHHLVGGNQARSFLQRSTGLKCATTRGTASNTLQTAEVDCSQAGLEKW